MRCTLSHTLKLLYLAALVLVIGPSRAAAIETPPPHPQIVAEGGYNVEPPHDNISPPEEQAIWDAVQRNIQQLQAEGVLAAPDTAQAVSYGWPVRLAPGITDYAGFYISAFADHNSAAGAWLDYNGGTRTYDTHRGTDIALWPFSWNKVDAGAVQVVAAAAGTIVQNQNQTPNDHNCPTGIAADGLGNYIVLQHADGRITIYGHMKYNSLTTKSIGQTVALGEYLGTVGSSGYASGPHVHFEVRSAFGGSELWLDPYNGSANPIASSWLSQRPYYDSAINKIATGTAGPVFTDCQPTVTNILDSFPAPARIFFQVYFRDYQGALPTQLNIYNPNGTLYQTWSYTNNAISFTPGAERHWAVDFPADAMPGTWRFEAQYNSQTYETFFKVGLFTNKVYLPSILR
jgi:murein DD-endopeptidase MepM/ murein hydrolase activator NlpD